MTRAVNLILAVLFFSSAAANQSNSSRTTEWLLPSLPAAESENRIRIRPTKNPTVLKNVLQMHSCYEAVYRSSTIHFCNPLVIVSGVAKAGTSAMYELLELHPNFVPGIKKENCARDASSAEELWNFFKDLSVQLKKAHDSGDKPAVLISGCLDSSRNLALHKLLHEPETLYIMMTRDFADYLWAVYNFWCSTKYDGSDCPHSQWADETKHYRSPGMFHEFIVAQMEGKTRYGYPQPLARRVVTPPGELGYFEGHAASFEKKGLPPNKLLVVASEQLTSDVNAVWGKITSRLNISKESFVVHPKLELFSKVRVNSGNNKGDHALTKLSNGYKSGVYAISKYKPLWDETRNLINGVWRNDCLWTSQTTGYPYPACHHV